MSDELLPEGSFFGGYLRNTGEEAVTKWLHYFDVYEREFTRFRNRPVTFLEIGVFRGGSIPMWKEFFADGSKLVFIDIDPDCKTFEIEGTTVEIGSQADPEFLARLASDHGPFDVILDDGSHINAHQIASHRGLWPALSDGGVYLVEDCHTSYWPGFGGGLRAGGSFMNYAKGLVDALHSWYSEEEDFKLDRRANEIHSVRFYDSIVAIEKQLKEGAPRTVHSKEGVVRMSRKWLQQSHRQSIFRGKDDS